jgi:hypothetical protein
MSIYKASKTTAQILISLTSITLIILNKYRYSSIIESSLPLIREE